MKIRKDGVIEWLTPPPLEFKIARSSKKRYSEIVPVYLPLLVAFRVIRFVFGEGKWFVPEFTRKWPCHWKMTIIETGFTAYSYNRQFLVDTEHEMFFKPKFDL